MALNLSDSMRAKMKVFGLGSSRKLAAEICNHLGLELEPLSEEAFPDGEIKIKPLRAVSAAEILVIHSMGLETGKNPSEKIWELLMFLSLLKDEGAGPLTVLLPYLCYSRSDQKKDPFDPLALRYLAQLLEAIGVARLLTLEVHNLAALQNAFRYPSTSVDAAPVFCEYLLKSALALGSLVVMSPDLGGIKRAEKFTRTLQQALARPVTMAILEKYREKEGLRGQAFVGDVQGAHVVIYDDMISTGQTVLRAASAAREHGALSVRVMAAHGLFSQDPQALLESPLIEEVVVTNSQASLQEERFRLPKLKVLSCAPLLAQGWAAGLISGPGA